MREILLDFIFIFLAAFPGRTTFVLVLLSATVSPWRILAGALPAFFVQCALGVLAGQWLKTLPHQYVQIGAGLLFLYFAWKFRKDSRQTEGSSNSNRRQSVASIFFLFFMAELGDVSQLAIAARAIESNSPLIVFAAAATAMTLIAGIAVTAGKFLGGVVKPSTLQTIAAAIFFIVGCYLVIGSF